jgi:shikimate kinase
LLLYFSNPQYHTLASNNVIDIKWMGAGKTKIGGIWTNKNNVAFLDYCIDLSSKG